MWTQRERGKHDDGRICKRTRAYNSAGQRSAGNAPDASYKISAGFCFVGAPQFDPDPVKAFFSALGVEYQSVG